MSFSSQGLLNLEKLETIHLVLGKLKYQNSHKITNARMQICNLSLEEKELMEILLYQALVY